MSFGVDMLLENYKELSVSLLPKFLRRADQKLCTRYFVLNISIYPLPSALVQCQQPTWHLCLSDSAPSPLLAYLGPCRRMARNRCRPEMAFISAVPPMLLFARRRLWATGWTCSCLRKAVAVRCPVNHVIFAAIPGVTTAFNATTIPMVPLERTSALTPRGPAAAAPLSFTVGRMNDQVMTTNG